MNTKNSTLVFSGHHAVVTGGSRGIGAAIANRLASAGAAVTLIARNKAALSETAKTLRETTGAVVHAETADVTMEADVATAFASLRREIGAPTILVNNAGGVLTGRFIDLESSQWQRMLDTNLTSVFLATRAALPAMIDGGFGRIVNVASSAGLEGYPYVAAYTAAKHGVVGLTRSLALETAGTGVTVNAVCPGYTDTDMLGASAVLVAKKTGRSVDDVKASYAKANVGGRLIQPDEVADVVVGMCAPDDTESGRICPVNPAGD